MGIFTSVYYNALKLQVFVAADPTRRTDIRTAPPAVK